MSPRELCVLRELHWKVRVGEFKFWLRLLVTEIPAHIRTPGQKVDMRDLLTRTASLCSALPSL